MEIRFVGFIPLEIPDAAKWLTEELFKEYERQFGERTTDLVAMLDDLLLQSIVVVLTHDSILAICVNRDEIPMLIGPDPKS